MQTHADFPPWPIAGRFYIFPNELRCCIVLNKKTRSICDWTGKRTIALRNHVHSQHLPIDLMDRKSHLRHLQLVHGSHGKVSSRLFTRAVNIYCARASGNLALEQEAVRIIFFFPTNYIRSHPAHHRLENIQ